jgi:hypothetical protein
LKRAKVLRALIATVLALVVLLGARLYGAYRWTAGTQELRARLDAARVPVVRPRTVDFRELEGLPAPVQRYFRAVLEEGHPMVAGARVLHTATFNMGETANRWRPFLSDQEVVTRRPGFDWDGRVAMVPGLPVRVRDAYGPSTARTRFSRPRAEWREGDASRGRHLSEQHRDCRDRRNRLRKAPPRP